MKHRKIKLLYDGGCPLCMREIRFLRNKDKGNNILFVDISSNTYSPKNYNDISYRDAMTRIHAITDTGEILRDVQVFREAYQLVGLGWVYSPTYLPLIGGFVDSIYALWARWRLRLTFRPSLDQLCKCHLDKSL